MNRAAVLLAIVLSVAACDSRRVDDLDVFASASCAAIQSWIDAIEDETTALSRAVTPLADSADRVEHYRLFAKAIDLRTWDTTRQLKHVAPTTGDAGVAADRLIAAMERSRGVTQELIALADSFPDGNDPESLTGRISSLFIRLEKAFTFPYHERRALAERYPAFDAVPACQDYANAVT